MLGSKYAAVATEHSSPAAANDLAREADEIKLVSWRIRRVRSEGCRLDERPGS